jgi:S-DNA-T family DNA segregation ATPase FtsK/SpoIIIE
MAKKRTAKAKRSKAKKRRDITPIQGLFLGGTAFILLLSLLSFAYGLTTTNWLGLLGSHIGWFFHASLGLGSYLLCLFIGWFGWRLFFNKSIHHPILKLTFMGLFILSSCMLLNLFEDLYPAGAAALRQLFYPKLVLHKLRYHLGGALLFYLYRDLPVFNLHHIFNSLGVAILFSCTYLSSLMFLAKVNPGNLLTLFRQGGQAIHQGWRKLKDSWAHKKGPPAMAAEAPEDCSRLVKVRIPGTPPASIGKPSLPYGGELHPSDLMTIQPEANLTVRPSISRKELRDPQLAEPPPNLDIKPPPKPPKELEKMPSQKKRDAALAAQKVHNGDFTGYQLPPASMLSNPKKIDQNALKKDLRRQAEVLEETLQSFGIEAKVGQINCGPTISSFEVHPAIGVKVQKIKTLENDIALNMEAKSIRIIAPIPGKAAVGIEVPNPQPQEVAFKELLTSYQQSGRNFHIPVLLGKAVNGDNVVCDLAKMPHCIIAGATGSGKSVCINTIVMSILMTAKPDEIKLIMVDPKKVELTPYTRLPHMLAPVITEPQGACAALNWLVKEMENRYEILKQVGVRNIEAFNNRKIDKEFEATLDREIPVKMPFIVGIIDELADLMMVASHDIETPIARIAQMARAVGIHLVLATQRPSREVITGLIKANFPTRISFKVASRVNSQIVLDEVGAEALLGNGDMLFLPPGSSHLIRAQGAFIRDEDINAAIKLICDQAPPQYAIASFDRMTLLDDQDSGDEDSPADSLYEEALDIILSTGTASTTFLQRKLKIGYARAASLMDQLESRGIVGPAEGSKPRKILAARAGGGEEASSSDIAFEEAEL